MLVWVVVDEVFAWELFIFVRTWMGRLGAELGDYLVDRPSHSCVKGYIGHTQKNPKQQDRQTNMNPNDTEFNKALSVNCRKLIYNILF